MQSAFKQEMNRTPNQTDGTIQAENLASPDEIRFIAFLTEMARHKWLLTKSTALASAAGVVLSFLLPVRYTATAKIMPPHESEPATALFMNQIASRGGSLAALAGSGLGMKNPDDIYIGLLQSRPVADAILQKFSLMRVYRSKDMTAARKKLADNSSIGSEKSGFIAISVTDSDRTRAAAMANSYAAQLRIMTQSLAVTEASQRRLFYEEQLKQAKQSLVAAEYAFEHLQQQKGLVQPEAQTRALITGISELDAQIAAKQVELQALRSYSTDRNPDVQIAEQELFALQQQTARLEQRSHSAGFANLGLADVPAASLGYLNAERELQYRETLYELLIKQYQAARLDESKEAAVVQVVETAVAPDRRSSPHRAAIITIFIFLGFLSASGYILIKEFLRENRDFARGLIALKSAFLNR